MGHPLHPIVVHVPMATWPGALIFDLLSQWNIGGNAMVRLSFYAIIFGLAASLLAIPTGLVDWAGIKKEKPAWKIGLYHMGLNLAVALLFAINANVSPRRKGRRRAITALGDRHGTSNRFGLSGRHDGLSIRHQRRADVEKEVAQNRRGRRRKSSTRIRNSDAKRFSRR